jgi:hypothetical protein
MDDDFNTGNAIGELFEQQPSPLNSATTPTWKTREEDAAAVASS